MKIEVGTVGLSLAAKLYGSKSVVSYGGYGTNGEVEVPAEELDTFQQLLKEELLKITGGRIVSA